MEVAVLEVKTVGETEAAQVHAAKAPPYLPLQLSRQFRKACLSAKKA